MDQKEIDQGVATELLERFERQRYPRAQSIRAQLEKGEKLSEPDLTFLDQVLNEASQILPLVERNPEYHAVAAKTLSLYNDLLKLAVDVERDDSKTP